MSKEPMMQPDRLVRAVLCLAAGVALTACDPVPMSPERAAQVCEEQARAAQGPTGSVTVGVNSRTGPYAGASIGITDDYLRGRDPLVVYSNCVMRRTGQAPIRPPVLR